MDLVSFHKLILAEVESIHRLAYNLCRDAHEAEDLVQETYLRALRSASLFQLGEYGVRPWLFKILHNVLHTRRARDRRGREAMKQRQEREPMEQTAALGSYTSGGVTSAGDATDIEADRDQLDERLYRAIRLLPVTHRTVFLLAAVEDLKYREIAEVVGVPVGTVMSRLARARTALAAQLGDLAAEQNLRPGRSEGRI